MQAIEGMYRWGDNIVRIERAPVDEWQTLYSSGSDSSAHRLPTFTHIYRVHLPNDCMGTCTFYGSTLTGSYASKWLSDAMARGISAKMSSEQAKRGQDKWQQGQITATLRPDGNFDAVIEVWDPFPPTNIKPMDFKTFKPNHERAEAEWVRI